MALLASWERLAKRFRSNVDTLALKIQVSRA